MHTNPKLYEQEIQLPVAHEKDVAISDVVREAAVVGDVQLSTYRNVCPAITWASPRTAPQATRREFSTLTSPKSYFISCWIQQIFAKRKRHFYFSKNKREFYISMELWSNNNCHTTRKLISSHWKQSIRTLMKLNTHTHTHTHTQIQEGTRYIFPIVWDDKI